MKTINDIKPGALLWFSKYFGGWNFGGVYLVMSVQWETQTATHLTLNRPLWSHQYSVLIGNDDLEVDVFILDL